jgi:hypothetical protein
MRGALLFAMALGAASAADFVEVGFVEVKTNGLALTYMGPFQARPASDMAAGREFTFRIPRNPQPAGDQGEAFGSGPIGVFLNGVPIYNVFDASSYQGHNLWHYDPLVATGGHPVSLGAIERIAADASRHSPLLGFALDGYPIYGPWAFAKRDGSGGLRAMRSSYRQRKIAERTTLADGTKLTASQAGPAIGADVPLGTFSEDYEFVEGAGDLDRFNGTFAVTPEYPAGTYAYFLTSAYPYLPPNLFRGQTVRVAAAFKTIARHGRIELRRDGDTFEFTVLDSADREIRDLEYVHERPMHVIVVSDDLRDFDHIHPELVAGGAYRVTHKFPGAGRYAMYVEFTAPGADQGRESFDLEIAGQPRTEPRRDTPPFGVELMRQGDILTFNLKGATEGLEPYLGAWSHVVIIGGEVRTFIHAHPLVNGKPPEQASAHCTAAAINGPTPDEIRVAASFPTYGHYKLWAQFQYRGEVYAVPFELEVRAP